MSTYNQLETGRFCWVELSTTDPAGSKKFYEQLFKWTYEDSPIPDGGTYTVVHAEGEKMVGGLYAQPAEKKQAGIPVHWLSYVLVDKVDATAEKAKLLGAQILAGPFDVMKAGRMAVVQDPTGAVFALWQANDHKGTEALGGPQGQLCWNELATNDVDRAGKFYIDLFGWKTVVNDTAGFAYTHFEVNGQPFAGMLKIQKEWGPVPPHWMVYFTVKSCDETAKACEQAGGKIVRPPQDIPNTGRFAILNDPQGGHFAILQPSADMMKK